MAELPEKIGPYRILGKLGEGGMGAVFEGLHEVIERKVAIKVLHPDYAQRPEFVTRLFNEARAVNRIDHPGIVQVSDYGQLPDQTAYIVMELLAGESLSARIKKRGGPIALEQALNIGNQVADALGIAHTKGVIHRDLKPDNIMVVPDQQAPGGERTKLLDFGIAKLTGETGPPQALTKSNAVFGTCYYMSPEQCRGAGKVDGRTDVYSLGVILYELLCGERPITGLGIGEVISRHLTQEPEPLANKAPQLPKAVTTLVHRMLIKDREQRPAMEAVAAELAALTEQYPPPARRRTTASQPIVPVRPSDGPSRMSLLGTAAFQAKRLGRRGGVGVVGILLAMVSLIVVCTTRVRSPSQPASSADKTVRFRIDSRPPGAAVVQVSDGAVLGKTPWALDRPAQNGLFKVRLYLPDYAGKELSLDASMDAIRTEVLEALPTLKGKPDDAGGSSGAGKGAAAGKPSSDDNKSHKRKHGHKKVWPFKF
jgi:serine/threonine protein kinase